MRGVHLKIFNYDGNVINDEFASPYMNSHSIPDIYAKKAKIFWYRKIDLVWPKCL